MRIRFLSCWTVSMISVVLTACVPRIPPKPMAAQLDIPLQWHEKTISSSNRSSDQNWWHQLNDPVLNDLIEQALVNNTDLAIAQTHIQAALAQEHIARSALLPTLDVSGGSARAQSLGALGSVGIARTEQPTFQAAYEIDVFGKNRKAWKAGKLSRQATEAAAAATRISVIATTVKSYITLRALDAQLDLLQQTLKTREKELKIAQAKAKAGYTSQLELSQAESEYADTLQQIPTIETSISQQEHALNLLIGHTSQNVPRGLSLAQLKPPVIPEILPSDLIQKRPDIIQATLLLAASDASLASAQAQFLPSVNISATLGRVFSTSPINEPVTIWSIGGSILAPIFEGGRIQAGFDQAVAKRNEAAWQYRQTVLTAFKEVEDQLASGYRLQQKQQALQMEHNAIAKALHFAQNRYHTGYSPYLDVLDSQRNLLNTENQLIQNQANYLTSQVSLYQALGGGWQNSLIKIKSETIH